MSFHFHFLNPGCSLITDIYPTLYLPTAAVSSTTHAAAAANIYTIRRLYELVWLLTSPFSHTHKLYIGISSGSLYVTTL